MKRQWLGQAVAEIALNLCHEPGLQGPSFRRQPTVQLPLKDGVHLKDDATTRSARHVLDVISPMSHRLNQERRSRV
jgi:lysophospholipase L1-like esterase